MCGNRYVILKAKDTVPLLVPGNLPTPETVVVEKVFACRWGGCYCCNGDMVAVAASASAAGITVSFKTLIEKGLHRVFVHNNNTGDAVPS